MSEWMRYRDPTARSQQQVAKEIRREVRQGVRARRRARRERPRAQARSPGPLAAGVLVAAGVTALGAALGRRSRRAGALVATGAVAVGVGLVAAALRNARPRPQ